MINMQATARGDNYCLFIKLSIYLTEQYTILKAITPTLLPRITPCSAAI